MTRAARTLLFSTLYPNAAAPLRGIFVETRLRELLQRTDVETKVVAPVPWFWSTDERHGRYAAMARAPRRETRFGIDVRHPRYLVVPKIGMNLAPLLLAVGALPTLALLQREGYDFDLIDAHYYYPDGVAAALLARWFRKPLAITARGTDVNLIPEHRFPRAWIQWAARRARASIGVSEALVKRMQEIGFPPDRLRVMRNGVDLDRFQPQPQAAARERLGLGGAGPQLLSVGNLHEHKGQRLVVDAFARLLPVWPQARLLLIGDGDDRSHLQRQVASLGLTDSVRFVGTVPNADLAEWYSAADVLVLASSREGWPNVLLEAMACGTPVVATAVGGIPEVVTDESVGRLVQQRDGATLAEAIRNLVDSRPDRGRVRAHAAAFGWERTSQDQFELFQSLVAPAP